MHTYSACKYIVFQVIPENGCLWRMEVLLYISVITYDPAIPDERSRVADRSFFLPLLLEVFTLTSERERLSLDENEEEER